MYAMFVKAYNEEREHGGINGHTPSEMFLMKGRLNSCKNIKTNKQIKSVTHVGKWICYLSMGVQQLRKAKITTKINRHSIQSI